MNVTDTYSPRAGSLAYRLIEFLLANPDEELTRADIACKFDASSASIDPSLAIAIEQKILAHKDDDDSLPRRWVAGPRIKSALLVKAAAANGEKPKKRTTPPPADMPAPGDLVIEKGVPCPPKQTAAERYVAVFENMEAGHSFKVPDSSIKRIYEHARKYGRRTNKVFTWRRDCEKDGSGRIWRVS